MACETISSFSITALPEDTIYYDSNGSPVTVGANTRLNKNNEVHRMLIRHLYRRIGYGASLADIEYADDKTIGQLVNYLIDDFYRDENGNLVPDPNNPGEYKRIGAANITLPVDANGNQMFDWQHRYMQITDIENKNVLPQAANTNQITSYWINEAITESVRGVRSKLMLFWHNHFVIEEPIYSVSYAVLRYYNVLFDNAFGNFKEFVKEIGRTPMMLVYLNGTENRGQPDGDYTEDGGPNENYARELLELFTMGDYYKGSQNYWPKDINELARALTGWTQGNHNDFTDIPTTHQFRFNYRQHDWGNKTLFEENYSGKDLWEEVFKPEDTPVVPVPTVDDNPSNVVAIGDPDAENPTLDDRYVAAGTKEYDKIHELIFNKKGEAVSYFICKKLYEFYIYGDTENPKVQELQVNEKSIETYIDSLATIFRNNSWNIIPVLKTLFKSQHFYDTGVIGSQIKSPMQCAVSFFHTADLKSDQDNNGPKLDDDGNVITDFDYTYQLTLMPSHYEGEDSPISNLSPPHPSYKPNYNNGKIRAMTGENALPRVMTDETAMPPNLSHEYGESFLDQDVFEIKRRCREMGQDILNPPNVAGWEGHQKWLNEYTLTRRWAMLNHFIDKFSPTTKDKFRRLAVKLMEEDPISGADSTSGELMVRSVWRHFFCVNPTDKQVADAIAVYKDGWTYDGVPNIGGYPASSSPTVPTTSEVAEQFMKMLEYMIRQPEYQLT